MHTQTIYGNHRRLNEFELFFAFFSSYSGSSLAAVKRWAHSIEAIFRSAYFHRHWARLHILSLSHSPFSSGTRSEHFSELMREIDGCLSFLRLSHMIMNVSISHFHPFRANWNKPDQHVLLLSLSSHRKTITVFPALVPHCMGIWYDNTDNNFPHSHQTYRSIKPQHHIYAIYRCNKTSIRNCQLSDAS